LTAIAVAAAGTCSMLFSWYYQRCSLALSVLLIAASVWLVRRRAA